MELESGNKFYEQGDSAFAVIKGLVPSACLGFPNNIRAWKPLTYLPSSCSNNTTCSSSSDITEEIGELKFIAPLPCCLHYAKHVSCINEFNLYNSSMHISISQTRRLTQRTNLRVTSVRAKRCILIYQIVRSIEIQKHQTSENLSSPTIKIHYCNKWLLVFFF